MYSYLSSLPVLSVSLFLLFLLSYSQRSFYSPHRGSPLAHCAHAPHEQNQNTPNFDAAPLIDPTQGAVPHHDDSEVLMNLSLLREALRDQWLHFIGDVDLKHHYFTFVSMLQLQGLDSERFLTAKEKQSRSKNRLSNHATKVSSTQLSFSYAPSIPLMLSDVTRVLQREQVPSLIIVAPGINEIYNVTQPASEFTAHFQLLKQALSVSRNPTTTPAFVVPSVVFVPPSLHAAALTPEQERRAKEINTLLNTVKNNMAVLQLDQHEVEKQVVENANSIKISIFPSIPPVLGAFITCHLGTPEFALSSFTVSQVALFIIFIVLLLLSLLRVFVRFSSSMSPYSRVSVDADELELKLELGGLKAANAHATNENDDANIINTPDSIQNQKELEYQHEKPLWQSWLMSNELTPILTSLLHLFSVLFFVFLLDGNQRVSWWLIGLKHYNRDVFLFLLVCIGLFAWLTWSSNKDKTEALLHREQSEEWKGVMQILFVLYHYFAAKEMYNTIRIFIAAYVFMTGYGNFIFFYKTSDFSFSRLMKMLFRLNFFVAFICLALNREFMQYYVCALHTFYFLCVYATMGICYHWNKSNSLLSLKFILLFAFLFILFDVPSLRVFQTLFSPFSVLYWNNSLHEWWFRSSLDHYATLFGMIVAWNIHRIENAINALHTLPSPRRTVAYASVVLISCGAGYAWLYYCLWLPKNAYNVQHPFTSMIPIFLYIVLRNLTPYLRQHVLHLFSWFGKITLETYILQFHVWLSDDAANIIMYFPNYPMINFCISTAIYVALSLIVFQLTNVLSDALIPRGCTTTTLLYRMCFGLIAWLTLWNVTCATANFIKA